MQLRPYQEAAKAAIFKTWEEHDRALLVLPTGCGKTIVFASVCNDIAETGRRCLIIAHREELLTQAAEKLMRTSGLYAVTEKGDQHGAESLAPVVVASVQTLCRPQRLEAFRPDEFAAVIIDEAHHALAPTYQRIIEYFKGKLLGVTATADRGDKRNLGEIFERLAYEYSLLSAVREGWLCRPIARTLPVKLDMSGVGISAGDFAAADVAHAIDPYLEDIAHQMATHCRGRKTVAFLPLIATSQRFAGFLKAEGLDVREVNGQSEDRAETLAWFHDAGPGCVLCNAMLLTEGWDEPSADCVVVLRPTKVRSLYAQMVGRGTRLYPGKKDLLLLDFLWHSDRHQLCRPTHLVCKNEDVSARVAELLEEETEGKDADLLDAVEEAENKAVEERENSLKKMLDEQRAKDQKLVDPLQFEASITGALEEYTPDPSDLTALAPPSERQKEALRRAGINPQEIQCTGHANRLLDVLALRRMEGLSTAKQIRFLEKRGFRDVGQWRMEEASNMISRYQAAGWFTPRGVNPETYKPTSLLTKEGATA